MNLRTVLTATWLCIVAIVYLSLYFVCHVAHSKFAGIIAAGSAAAAKGKRNKSGSVQNLIEDVEIGSGLWLAEDDSSSDEERVGSGRTILLIEGDPV